MISPRRSVSLCVRLSISLSVQLPTNRAERGFFYDLFLVLVFCFFFLHRIGRHLSLLSSLLVLCFLRFFLQGAVYCWGAADCVGDGTGFCRYAPVLIRLSLALSSHLHAIPPCLAFCRTIAARFQQTMAVTAGGHLLVWGEAFFANFHPTPEVLCVFPRAPHHQVIQIAIGKHFGLALTGRAKTSN